MVTATCEVRHEDFILNSIKILIILSFKSLAYAAMDTHTHKHTHTHTHARTHTHRYTHTQSKKMVGNLKVIILISTLKNYG